MPLLLECIDSKKKIALPRVNKQKNSLSLYAWNGEKLDRGAYDIPEPSAAAPEIDPANVDFAIIPALAADEQGHRVGYGKGYYDRLIPTLNGATTCVALFDFQLVAEVPAMAHDVSIDLVATDIRLIRTERDIQT